MLRLAFSTWLNKDKMMNILYDVINLLMVFLFPLMPVHREQKEDVDWNWASEEDQMSNPDTGFWRPNHIMMGENDIIGINIGDDGL